MKRVKVIYLIILLKICGKKTTFNYTNLIKLFIRVFVNILPKTLQNLVPVLNVVFGKNENVFTRNDIL